MREELWEKIFDELDRNQDWNEFCDKWAPTGTFDIDDDNLQSFIAQLLAEEREKHL